MMHFCLCIVKTTLALINQVFWSCLGTRIDKYLEKDPEYPNIRTVNDDQDPFFSFEQSRF